ncbi:hypothetical protein GALL_476530 [mine drainage metagenome]|uniref:Uncharacterized protein n=1 Tax=mine drainage metagenome TaxID=410659 RepID=A0A1J5PZL9_9ZZZZ
MRARLDHRDHVRRLPLILQLHRAKDTREAAAIDLSAQLGPQMPQRADVILMRVGDKNRLDPVGAFFQPADIRQDQINTGRPVHIREGHPQIDDDQPLFSLTSIAIDVAIHPDLPRAAKGKIDQALFAHTFSNSRLYLWITVNPCMVRSSSTLSNSVNP